MSANAIQAASKAAKMLRAAGRAEAAAKLERGIQDGRVKGEDLPGETLGETAPTNGMNDFTSMAIDGMDISDPEKKAFIEKMAGMPLSDEEAAIFVTLHEVGHLELKLGNGPNGQPDPKNEQACHQFAKEIFQSAQRQI